MKLLFACSTWGLGLGVSQFLLGVLLFHCIPAQEYRSATPSTAPAALPATEAFGKWLAQQRISGPRGFMDPQELAAGLKLAEARAAELCALMERNPEEFVRLALLAAERAQLPPPFQPFMERQIKGRGVFRASCALPSSGRPALRAGKTTGLDYEAQIDGVIYQAFVFGKWRSQRSVREAMLEGVALGHTIAFGRSHTPDEQAAAGDPVVLDAPDASGTNTLLYLIARFLDETNSVGTPLLPIDDATALLQMDAVNAFWLNNSGRTVGIRGLVNPGQVVDILHIILPHPKSYGPTYDNNFSQLLTDARSAAAALGYDYADYNLDAVVTSDQGFTYGGRANLFTQGAHFVVPDTTLRTVGHELGHNLGLYHANYWRTDALSPYGPDSIPGGYVSDDYEAEWLEYGHYFSIMSAQSGAEMNDPGKPYYAPAERAYLGWLSGSQLQYVNSSGTYRLFRHDHPDTVGMPRAIQITTSAADYTGNERKYWLSYRYAPWNTAQSWFRNGLQVEVANYGGYDYDGAILLDMTPYSKDTPSPFFDKNNKPGNWWTIDNSDKVDGALVVGHTYSDRGAGIHITPVAIGNNGRNEEYIDLVIHFGKSPLNRAPAISGLSATTNHVASGQSINFSVSATDPEGDTLAYAWDFGEVQVWTQSGLNRPAATKSWPAAGQYRVTVTVSDLKGGVASESMLVTVGVPANTSQIWGRVLWAGRPVGGARLWATVWSTVYQAWTDTDGTYALTDLPATNNYPLNCLSDCLTFTAQFSNPVSVASGNAFGRDFHANEPAPPDPSFDFTLSGNVSYGGNGVPGAEVRAGGRVALCDYSGNYQFTNLPAGSYSIAPQNGNWTFVPASRTATLTSADSPRNDFSRLAAWSISGRIDGLPAGPSDLTPTVYLSNGHSVIATRQGGATNYWIYTLTSVPAGQFSVSAELWNYGILPSGFGNPLLVTGNLSNVNFTGSAAAIGGAIKGRITELGLPLSGVTVAALKISTVVGSALTDSDGYYRIPNATNGTYTLVPIRAGYLFSPASQIFGSLFPVSYNFTASGPHSAPVVTSLQAFPTVVADSSATSTLSAAASGNAPLNYSWDALTAPAPVAFSANDSLHAALTVVSFRAPGNYAFRLRVTDINGFSTTSNISLSVLPRPFALVVSPFEVQVAPGGTVAFRAGAWDQLGHQITVSPVWSVSGGGNISTGGVFSATTLGGPYHIGAVAGTLSGTGSVSVISTSQVPVLKITGPGTGPLSVRFEGLPGMTYRLEFAEDLEIPVWQPLATTTADQFGRVEFTDLPPPGTSRRYYRSVYSF